MNVYGILSEVQAGFRENYSTVDNAFILQAIINKTLAKKHGKIYVAFVDFKPAFDKVNRHKLWSILQDNGIQGKLYNTILSMYNRVTTRIRSSDGLSTPILCPTGHKQEYLVSPALFCIFINELAKLIANSE